jgi:TRAP-type mannitol/chloroaromatic compound transport system substrate-binding protein
MRTGRRRFIAQAGGVAAGAAAATLLAKAPSVMAQPKIQWRMSTAWPKQLDVMQGLAERLGTVVQEMSGGRFRIEVFPGGQIMKAFECFDETSKGTIECFMGTASYWAPDRDAALQWFMSIPFGMDPQGMASWYYQGDGRKLMEETYAPYNVVPRLGPAFAPQMGGWFKKKINAIGDYKGLRMRIAGLGGLVVAKAGGSAVVTPAGDIFGAFERGVIDAAEWVGPHDDMKLGLQNTARYYYYPGWHEPGTVSDFGFNRKAYDALPADLKQILDLAAASIQIHGSTEYHAKNALALERLKTEYKGKVELVQFPAPVLRDLKKLSAGVVREQSERSAMARKVSASFARFQAALGPWDDLAEGSYHQLLRK